MFLVTEETMPPTEKQNPVGRPRSVTDDELIDALQSVLSPLAESAATTEEVIDAVDTTATDKTVLSRLQDAREDESVPIAGKKSGTGWQWWLTSTEYYDHLNEN